MRFSIRSRTIAAPRVFLLSRSTGVCSAEKVMWLATNGSLNFWRSRGSARCLQERVTSILDSSLRDRSAQVAAISRGLDKVADIFPGHAIQSDVRSASSTAIEGGGNEEQRKRLASNGSNLPLPMKKETIVAQAGARSRWVCSSSEARHFGATINR